MKLLATTQSQMPELLAYYAAIQEHELAAMRRAKLSSDLLSIGRFKEPSIGEQADAAMREACDLIAQITARTNDSAQQARDLNALLA